MILFYQWYQWYSNIVQGSTNGKLMVPLAPNGTIGKISNGTIGRNPNTHILVGFEIQASFDTCMSNLLT